MEPSQPAQPIDLPPLADTALDDDQDPHRNPAEDAAREALIEAGRSLGNDLLESLTPSNAPRTLTQIGKTMLGLRKILVLYGDHELPEESEVRSRGPRALRNRETMGVHALRDLASSYLAGQRGQRLAALLQASKLAADQGMEAEAEQLRDQARELMQQAGSEDAADVAHKVGLAMTGTDPDEYEASEVGAASLIEYEPDCDYETGFEEA